MPASRSTRRTELDHYPATGQRFLCLAIVVVATIVLYYQFYLAGAVAAGTGGKNGILVDYHMSFPFYVYTAGVGYILGAVASFVTGVADKYGRVNIVTIGLVVVALLCLFGIPLADSKFGFAVVFIAIGAVEGVILVATPALIRDFSPQLGRASAMGFWTLGPVLGSLVVSIQLSSTSNTTPWHDQYIAAGIVGLIVAVASAVFLRELTPELRDQLMVSHNDRALIEARAKGIDVEKSTKGPFGQMLKPNIVLSALAISVFLIIYYIAVGFFPPFFQTVFGYTQSRANSLGNYVWAFDAAALLIIGILSDKVRVRKPFMVVGAIGAIVMTVIFALKTTDSTTSYTTFAVVLSLLAVFLGVAYAPWMASFTETVEERNPALSATGLAIWGLVIRLVIAILVFIVPSVVNTVTTLVQKGPTAQALAATYSSQLATAAKVDPATLAALTKDPTDQTAGVKAISEITGISVADVTTVATVSAAHSASLADAQKVDSATLGALAANPTDQAAGVKAVSEISGVSQSDVVKVAALAQQYKAELATAAQVSTATQASLASNPSDTTAQAQAISQISGVSIPDVATIITLNAQHAPAIAAANAIDTTTITTLLTNPTDTTALQTAVGEVTSKLNISQADAATRLADLKTIPTAQLTLLQQDGAKVVAAAAQLTALAKVPAADLALLSSAGPKITLAAAALKDVASIPAADLAKIQTDGPKIQAAQAKLVALGQIPPADTALLQKVQKAAKDSPKQWQHLYWIAVGGEIVFIPLIFLLTGFWSPRRARKQEEDHEQAVQQELASLGS